MKFSANIKLARKLINNHVLFYSLFGIVFCFVFYFICSVANNGYFRMVLKKSESTTGISLFRNLSVVGVQTPELRKFSTVFPDRSFVVFSGELKERRCVIYDVRLSDQVSQPLVHGNWPTEAVEFVEQRPVIVSEEYVQQFPLGSIIDGEVAINGYSSFLKGDFKVVGVLSKNSIVFDREIQNPGFLYDAIFYNFNPNYSGFITFASYDEIKERESLGDGHNYYLYDITGINIDNYSLNEFERYQYSNSSLTPLPPYNDFKPLDHWRLIIASVVILWITSLAGVAGITATRDKQLLMTMRRVGAGKRRIVTIVFLKSSITIVPAIVGLLLARPYFGVSKEALFICFVVWFLYILAMTLVSVGVYSSMEEATDENL